MKESIWKRNADREMNGIYLLLVYMAATLGVDIGVDIDVVVVLQHAKETRRCRKQFLTGLDFLDRPAREQESREPEG